MTPFTILCLSNELKKILEENNIKNYSPAYGGESVGLDLYNTGEDVHYLSSGTLHHNTDYSNEKKFKQFIHTGLRVAIPKGFCGLILERGSITKTALKIRAGVIDPGYTGEILINAINLSSYEFTIKHGAKTPFQLIIVPANINFKTVSIAEYTEATQNSKRNEGRIGSSD